MTSAYYVWSNDSGHLYNTDTHMNNAHYQVLVFIMCILSCDSIIMYLTQVSEVGLASDVLPVPPSHKGVSRRLIYTTDHGLVELPSSLSWLFRTKPPFSRPLLPAVLTEIFRSSFYMYTSLIIIESIERNTTSTRA